MIAITEGAKQELKKILTTNTDEPEACLRLIANDEGQLGLAVDTERQEDQVVEHEDSKVLVVEKNLADTLEGITMDVVDTPEGNRLAIHSESESQ